MALKPDIQILTPNTDAEKIIWWGYCRPTTTQQKSRRDIER